MRSNFSKNRELSSITISDLIECGTVGGNSGYSSGEQSTSSATNTDGSSEDLSKLDETYRNSNNKSGATSENDNEESAFSSNSSFDEDDEDDLFRDFMPKKSCLKTRRHQQVTSLLIDTTSAMNGISMDAANATSSPLYPVVDNGSSSPNSSAASLSLSSLGNGSMSLNTSSSISSSSNTSKKRVSFADNCGKELFTVRTMSEPSNCPPKLTSKVVQYFLNREFSSSGQGCAVGNSGVANEAGFSQNLNYLLQSQLSNPSYTPGKLFVILLKIFCFDMFY
jgi:hypothetical protein